MTRRIKKMKIGKRAAAALTAAVLAAAAPGTAAFAAEGDGAKIVKPNGTETFYASVFAALNLAYNGDTVVMLEDYENTAASAEPKEKVVGGVTIDLNGHTADIGPFYLQTSDNSPLTITGEGSLIADYNAIAINKFGSVTVKDGTVVQSNAKDTYSTITCAGELTVENASIKSVGQNVEAVKVDGGSFTINGSGSVVDGYDGGVFVADGGTFTMNDGTVKSENYNAVYGNGTPDKEDTSITINGGEITSEIAVGMYLPQPGKTEITGGTITGGATAVEIASGSLTVSGGALVSTSKMAAIRPGTDQSDGFCTAGAALAVTGRTPAAGSGYAGKMDISISGGTFEGIYGFEKILRNGDESASINSLSITGGTFTGRDGIDGNDENTVIEGKAVYAGEGCTDNSFISGGVFSTDVSGYTESGYTCLEAGDDYSVYKTQASKYSKVSVESNKDAVDNAMNTQIGEGSSESYELHKVSLRDVNGNVIRLQYSFGNGGQTVPWYHEFTQTTFTDANVDIGVILYNIPEGTETGEPSVYIK